jgi:chromosome segregation ATPase
MSINPIEPNNIKPITDTKNVTETKNITNIQSPNTITPVSNPTDQITTNPNISSEVLNNNPQANSEVIQEPPLEVKLQQVLTDNNLPLEEKIKLIDKLINQKKQEIQNIDNEINNLKSNQTNRSNDPIGQKILNIFNQNKILALESQKSTINKQISMLEATKNNLVNLNNESRNLTSQLENINSVYDTSLNQLKMLKEQIERYYQSMASNYNKQIEILYNQINQLEKEIQDLLNTHPSNPDEANQIAQQIAQKRALQDTLRNQVEEIKNNLFQLTQNIQQQITVLDEQIGNMLKQKQASYYQKWALEQSIRREIENIVWGEMLNEKNHVLNMWKMYYDYGQKVRQMWQDIYTKQLANESSFIAAWSKALGA